MRTCHEPGRPVCAHEWEGPAQRVFTSPFLWELELGEMGSFPSHSALKGARVLRCSISRFSLSCFSHCDPSAQGEG